MLTAIDHIEIIVRDLDAYVDYLQKLGFELITHTTHHGGSAELKLPGDGQPIFELHEVGGEEVIGINHIAFRTDNVDAAYEGLVDTGIKVEEPPHDVASTGRTNINLRDPDGWRVQIVGANRRKPI